MSRPRSHTPQHLRDGHRGRWRTLIAEARACVADPRRKRETLKGLAQAGFKGWFMPTDDDADEKAIFAFRHTAEVYARWRRADLPSLGAAVGSLADVADEILRRSEPVAAPTPYYVDKD